MIAEQAPAPVTSDTAQEAREVLQMIADADTGTIQVDIDDEIASSDCRHCEWMKERAKEYLESHPAPADAKDEFVDKLTDKMVELGAKPIDIPAPVAPPNGEQWPEGVESHPCDTKPVESHQPAGDEAKWPEDLQLANGAFRMEEGGLHAEIYFGLPHPYHIFIQFNEIDKTTQYFIALSAYLAARQGGTV
jgi:hypothetical protein